MPTIQVASSEKAVTHKKRKTSFSRSATATSTTVVFSGRYLVGIIRATTHHLATTFSGAAVTDAVVVAIATVILFEQLRVHS